MPAPKKPRKRDALPDLRNATPMAIVDWLGSTRVELAKLKKLEGYYKEGLKAKLEDGEDEVEGEEFRAEIVDVCQRRLDNELVKEEMGAQWWDKHCHDIEFQQIRTSKL